MMQPEEVELPVRPAPLPELVPSSSRSRWKALLVVLVVGAVLAAGGVLYWNYAATYESTDDAQVGAHLNGISARGLRARSPAFTPMKISLSMPANWWPSSTRAITRWRSTEPAPR